MSCCRPEGEGQVTRTSAVGGGRGADPGWHGGRGGGN